MFLSYIPDQQTTCRIGNRVYNTFFPPDYCCGIRPLLLRRPKVVFFGAQAEKALFFFFFGAASLWCTAAK